MFSTYSSGVSSNPNCSSSLIAPHLPHTDLKGVAFIIFSSLDLDVRIIGEEYKDTEFTAKNICQKRGIKLVYNKRDHDFSTTNLRERIYNQESNKRFLK
jgi:glycerol-3-phosphate cytidylyltransferase